jgi:UDP-N-acetylmuramate dehydrogenase
MDDLRLKPGIENNLHKAFGSQLKQNVSLARYTAARLGGNADNFLEVTSVSELVQAVSLSWQNNKPFVVLGGGSNVLVSDAGVRGLVILNRARTIQFSQDPCTVFAESGTNFGIVARQAASRGYSGLEWASGIPGTIGGAVVGNAGAHGSDMNSLLILAEILHPKRVGSQVVIEREEWLLEKFEYSYRSSVLKKQPGNVVILSALLQLEASTQAAVQKKMEEFSEYRRSTQPPGASMGSMFKNPAGDYAGRLIESAGLKGARVGDAQISPKHANFFINLGNATSTDIYNLIQIAQGEVLRKFGIQLDLEIELIGEW